MGCLAGLARTENQDGRVQQSSSTHPVARAALRRASLVPLQGYASLPLQKQGAVAVQVVVVGGCGPGQQGGQWVVGDHADRLDQRQG